jgi:hypothetical protein
LIFLLSPFRVRGKKAEKSDQKLICQSRTKTILLIFAVNNFNIKYAQISEVKKRV